jgi:FKBP-type peptidyl-prolyl cis-trans isomerase SlyD
MKIANDCVVSFDYTLTNDRGEVLDSSGAGEPLRYLHGAGNIIAGLERELTDKTTGDAFNVSIQPVDAYGEVREDLIQEVPLSAFPVDEVNPGMRFEAGTQNGPVSVVVTAVTEQTATVDGNHPLAGEVLHFDVRIVDVRPASEEELAHGHVHGDGGVHH